MIADVVDDLARRYVRRIAETRSHAVIMQPPPPANRRPNVDLPFVGTLRERVQAHGLLTIALARETAAHGLPYLTLPRRYSERDGSLRRVYSDDGVHIAPSEAGPVITNLERLTGAAIEFRRSPWEVIGRRANYYFGGTLRRRSQLLRQYQIGPGVTGTPPLPQG